MTISYKNDDGTQEKGDNEFDSKGNITKSTDYEWKNGGWVKTYESTYVYTFNLTSPPRPLSLSYLSGYPSLLQRQSQC
jgi:hypothetical protein